MGSLRLAVESHVFDLPCRLKELDPTLEVWYNTVSGKYEVWGVDAARQRYCLGAWPFLDARVERAVRRGYWLARNTGDPYRAVIREQDEAEYSEERRLEREREDLPRVVKSETRWLIGGQWRGWRAEQ